MILTNLSETSSYYLFIYKSKSIQPFILLSKLMMLLLNTIAGDGSLFVSILKSILDFKLFFL